MSTDLAVVADEPIRVKGKHTPADVKKALLALALHGDSVTASEITKIPDATIRRWRRQHPELYRRLADEHQAEIEQGIAFQLRENVVLAAEVTRKALMAAGERLNEGKDENPARTATEAAKAMGIDFDKYALLQGRPTNITEHRADDDLIKAMESMGRARTIDSDAIEEAEIVGS